MKIAVLTSSRADYGIYLPLLKALKQDPFFDLHIIAFGTHVSKKHGYTISSVKEDGFEINHQFENVSDSDTPRAIAASMAATVNEVSAVWEKENYELVICLGDRYEMFAAVSAGVPFNIPFAHIHGGETTLGAIDNMFRHSISLFSQLHFVATPQYAEKVKQLTGTSEHVHLVGALSLDNLKSFVPYSKQDFLKKFKADLSKPTLLVTYHPETVEWEHNEERAMELTEALKAFPGHQVIITMPNADTNSNGMRKVYEQFASGSNQVFLFESMGTKGYFSAMTWCDLIIGNSSSGVIEAATFKKYVVDIGNRQAGRAASGNLIHSKPDKESIIAACSRGLSLKTYEGENIYYQGGAVDKIIEALKKWKN